jgi:hypothetical protein
MVQLYLYLNAFSYLLFAVWCLVKPAGTANGLGYSFLNNTGKVEYLSLYTGLELGFAAFLAFSAYFPSLRTAGLLWCVCIYIGLMIVRPAAAAYYGDVNKMTYFVGAMEYALGIWGIVILVMGLRNGSIQLYVILFPKVSFP